LQLKWLLFITDGPQKGLAFGNVFFTFNALGGEAVDDPQDTAAQLAFGYDHFHGVGRSAEDAADFRHGFYCTPLLQKSEAFSLRDSKGEAVVGYCDPLILRRLGASGFPEG
jgi:hypothetical protein